MAEKFAVIFSGKLVDGFDLKSVKKAVAPLVGNDEKRLSVLFSGKPVAVKITEDENEALKIRKLMEQRGAICTIKAEREPVPEPPPEPVDDDDLEFSLEEVPPDDELEYSLEEVPEDDDLGYSLEEVPADDDLEYTIEEVPEEEDLHHALEEVPSGGDLEYALEDVPEEDGFELSMEGDSRDDDLELTMAEAPEDDDFQLTMAGDDDGDEFAETPEMPTMPESQPESPDDDNITCPACGHVQPDAEECIKCGVLIHKFESRKFAEERGVPTPDKDKKEEEKVTHLKRTKGSVFRLVRKLILLAILVLVGFQAYQFTMRVTNWDQTIRVVVYPINADLSQPVIDYLKELEADVFAPIETFFSDEAEAVGLDLANPVAIELGPAVTDLPPEPPVSDSLVDIIMWSLKLRFYAFQNDPHSGEKDIRIYVKYRDPSKDVERETSIGMRKTRVGVVNAPADVMQHSYINLIVAHEIMHTLGAKDKYDPVTLRPTMPDGYADPFKRPIHPQSQAEIMGGHIPISTKEIARPRDLGQVTMGVQTLLEINWLKESDLVGDPSGKKSTLSGEVEGKESTDDVSEEPAEEESGEVTEEDSGEATDEESGEITDEETGESSEADTEETSDEESSESAEKQ